MSKSVHTSRAKFRKAFHTEYSSDEERTKTLGKIIDEIGLKRAFKANKKVKKAAAKQGLPYTPTHYEKRDAASKKSEPSQLAKELVERHNRKGYGRK